MNDEDETATLPTLDIFKFIDLTALWMGPRTGVHLNKHTVPALLSPQTAVRRLYPEHTPSRLLIR